MGMADDVYLAKRFHLLLVMLGTLSGQEAMLVPPTERSVEGPLASQNAFLSLFLLSLWSCTLLDDRKISSYYSFTCKIVFFKNSNSQIPVLGFFGGENDVIMQLE